MNMCDRLTCMIGGLATPVDVKLQLIQVFQHMHHDTETATTVCIIINPYMSIHNEFRQCIYTILEFTGALMH